MFPNFSTFECVKIATIGPAKQNYIDLGIDFLSNEI